MTDTGSSGPPEPTYRVAATASRAADVVLGAVAAAVLFAMMALTTVDVIGRYVFNSPLRGAYELTQLLMIGLIFAGLPTVTRRADHITVGLFNNAFRGWVRTARDAIIALIVAVGASYLAWRTYGLAMRFSVFGDVTASAKIPLAPIAFAGAAALLLSALAALVLVAEALVRGRVDSADRHEERAE
jgi:TRAP-type C4-dicarboxylate transport system permease small subunit